MVRFHWHVEDGLGACVSPGQLVYLRDHGVLQAMVEIEMPGQTGSLEACMTIPQNYNTDSGVREVGVLLAHGCDASDWRGRLLSELAVMLARAGFLVMRYIAPAGASEAGKVAAFEKAADAAATSPYARGVTRWVLAGLGSGARVAAAAGNRFRSGVAGYVLMSYPLREEMPCMAATADGGGPAPAALAASSDSAGPLMPLTAPLLFVSASGDLGVTEGALVELGPRLATGDVRSVVLQDADPHFRTLSGKGPHAATVRAIAGTVHEFINAANAYRMDLCKLPRLWRGGNTGGMGMVGGEGGAEAGGREGRTADANGRPQLQRPACFRPIPTGPPPQLQNHHLQQQQLQQQLLVAAAAAGHGGVAYGLNAATAQALAAQLQQRQAATVAAAAASGASGQSTAAQFLTQQVLLHQAAAAVQRRSSEHQAGIQATAAARAGGGGIGSAGNPLASGLAQALSDPNTAAQLAAVLIRNQQYAQQQQAAGGGAGTSLTVEALTSALVQRLAAQQQGGGAASAQQLLAATLLKHQQQPAQLQTAGGAAAAQQQQLQQLLLQHQLHQQQQQRQQQQQQPLALQLGDASQLGRQQQQALLLQAAAAAGLRTQGSAGGAAAASPSGAGLTTGGAMMLQANPSGLLGAGGYAAGGLGGGLGGRDGDIDMDD